MTEYVIITYCIEDINKEACYLFSSPHDNLDCDPYGGNVPFSVGSNQAIFKKEDAPFVPEDIPDNRIST